MFSFGVTERSGTRVELGFNRQQDWTYPRAEQGGDLVRSFANIGDPVCGPIVKYIAYPPGETSPVYPAHLHASDNYRVSLRGRFTMGHWYDEGEFRIQEGWRPYPRDSFAEGPDGGWMLLMFADRRGQRGRIVDKDADPEMTENRSTAVSLWEGSAGDIVSDDPRDGAGPSWVWTTLGKMRPTHLDGSFRDVEAWRESGGVRFSLTLLGDLTHGPVLLSTSAPAGTSCFPAGAFPTEVLRVVVSGSCRVGDRVFAAGDGQAQAADVAWDAAVAGDESVTELVLFGDRCMLGPSLPDAWRAALEEGQQALTARSAPTGQRQ